MILLCTFSLSCLPSFCGNFCNDFRAVNGTIQLPSLYSSVLVSELVSELLQQLLHPPDTSGTQDPTRSVGMWDSSERSPLETAGFERREIIFEQKPGIFCGNLFCKSKTWYIFIFFWICLQTVWVRFLKSKIYGSKNSRIFEVRKIITVKISGKTLNIFTILMK